MSIVIVILICFLIFQKPVTFPPKVDNSGLKKEITDLHSQNDSLTNLIENLEIKRDTIILYKDSIRHIYHETIQYINTSTIYQLDSIIRSNWN